MRFSPRQLAICLSLMIVALVTYWPVTQAKFVSWDDTGTILQNPAMEHPGWKIFWQRLRHPYLAMYMPITQTFYQAARLADTASGSPDKSEIDPGFFHWGMIAIALANIPLIFIFLRRLVGDDWAAAAGAALMVLHPINDEAIAWISEVSIPLCTFFLLCALLLWLNFRRDGRKWFYIAAFLFYILALLTKPICICIPFMAGALDIFLLNINWKRSIRQLWPWLLPAVVLGAYMARLQPILHENVYTPPLWQRPAVAVDAIAFYLGKILIPINLAIDYGRTPDWALQQHRALLLEGTALLLIAAVIWNLPKRRPILICAAIFFLTGMGAVLGLTPFWFQVFSTVGDRYVYIPLLGVAMAIAGLLAGVRIVLPWILIGLAILICACLTYHQEEYWHDTAALYAHEIQVHPHGWMGWDNTAYMLIGRQQWAQGLMLARVAYALDSTQPDIYSNIGMVLAANGEPGQAIPYFRRMIYAKPKDSITAMNLGAAYVQVHQYDLGIKWLRYAQSLNPTSKKVAWLLNGALKIRDQEIPLRSRSTTRP